MHNLFKDARLSYPIVCELRTPFVKFACGDNDDRIRFLKLSITIPRSDYARGTARYIGNVAGTFEDDENLEQYVAL